MATKSFLKNVDIKDKKLAKTLVLALEHASNKHRPTIEISRTYSEVKGEKIAKHF
ncbi:MAG: hypothetical protein PUE95_05930 [Lachnospiraceae bacterium]|nr:hypothetical protein [Lachnospiraceae bacterium]